MQTFQYIALLGMVTSALATCTVQQKPYLGKKETDTHRCTPRSDGKWTITMETRLIEIPNPGNPSGTFEETIDFFIYDAKCMDRGGFSKPSCGVPYHVQGGALKQPVIVGPIQADVGSPYMKITHGGVEITATCNKHASGLMAISDCQAHFGN